jgi:hypothetical protein
MTLHCADAEISRMSLFYANAVLIFIQVALFVHQLTAVIISIESFSKICDMCHTTLNCEMSLNSTATPNVF